MPTQSFDVSLPQGTLRGVDDDGVTAFRGIPYAASPVGELRFRPPGLHPGWHGVRDAATPGPSVPQLESRLTQPDALGRSRFPER
jgi:para-nitrobenzyl esterase